MKLPSLFAIGFIGFATLLFTACHNHDAVKQADTTNAEKKDSSMTTSASADDAQFATKAASGGMMEVQLGQIAQKSQDMEIKKFGAMMVTDHTKGNDELKRIAASKNITLPDSMSNKDQGMVEALSKKSGKDFDKAYIDMMVDDHNEDIAMFKKESDQGSDSDIKTFASNTLSVLQKHLDAAKATQKVVEGK